jgi:hypothetical protein
MTLQECLSFSPFEIVWQYMSVLHPDYIELRDMYEAVYNDINAIEAEQSEYSICIDKIESKTEPTRWEVFGVNGTRNKDIPEEEGGVSAEHPHADRLVPYSLMYQSRAKWAGMKIDSFTVCEMPTIDIAAQCLKEMTSIGFDEESVEESKNELSSRVEESAYIEKSDYVEITDGVFCHKDKVDIMKRLLALTEGEDKV